MLADFALSKKLEWLHYYGTTHSKLLDFIFKPVREIFGGRVKFMCTGSAPVSGEVYQFNLDS